MMEIKTGRLGRLAKLGKLGARAAGATLRGKSGPGRLADAMVEELGAMKGLPMKLGQILSYMDGIMPADQQDAFSQALATLRAHAPAVDNAACLAQIEAQLGAPRGDIFEAFDESPIASASIGQVYAATHQGRAVVVKVQYPGIKEATLSDLKNLDGLMSLFKRFAPTMDIDSVLDNFRERMHEEFDYRREASYQSAFADIYRNDPDLIVPDVLDALTRDLVITSERIEGISFEAFLRDAGQEERNRYGMSLFRFAFSPLLRHGLFHADPHPGNLFFRVGGDKLGVLDYGCVQPFDAAPRARMARLLREAAQGRSLREPFVDALGLDVDDPTLDEMLRIAELVLRPIRDMQPFTFTRPFASDIAQQVVTMKLALQKRMLLRRARFSAHADGFMFVIRTLFGLAALWGQLGATGHYRKAILDDLGAMPPLAAGAPVG